MSFSQSNLQNTLNGPIFVLLMPNMCVRVIYISDREIYVVMYDVVVRTLDSVEKTGVIIL